MVISKTKYRGLVLLSFFANMLWTFYREMFWDAFDSDVQRLLSADGYGSLIPGASYLFWFILVLSITCYVGLFFFKRWSVWLLLFLNVGVLIVMAPFGGVEISAPIERIAKTIFLMADGALIALAISSDLKTEFR